MGFAEGMAAGDEGDGFLVVHGHAAEGFADVAGGGDWVGIPVGAFGVDVNEAHLDSSERVFEVAVTGIAFVVEPLGFPAPIDVLVRFPHVGATAGEAEGFEAHGFEGDVAGEDHEVGPRDFAAVFLFDGPEQAAGFVEADVVGPGVERGEALLTATAAAAAVPDAVSAGAVPGHADEQRPIVAEIGGPPLLRISHEFGEVLLERVVVQTQELAGVIEISAHGIGLFGVLVEDFQGQGVRPPVAVGGAEAGGNGRCNRRAVLKRAFRFSVHVAIRLRFAATSVPERLGGISGNG